MKRFRWLNDRDQFRYIGRARPARRGRCACVVLPPYGAGGPKNVLVQFADGYKMVVPHGTLRKLKEKDDE